MGQVLRALVVDDDSTMRYAVRGVFDQLGFEVVEAPDGMAALDLLDAVDFQLVVTDIQMPRMDGLALLKQIRERPAPQPRVVVMIAHGSERQTGEAIKLGAFDYFKKPFAIDKMKAVAKHAAEAVRLTADLERLESERALGRTLIFGAPSMSRLAVLVQRVAPRDVTVLLTGESGTGKERVADALVQGSLRATKPFLRFDCAALPAERAEAELFGYSEGAFTGAAKSRMGLFREANGGTLFLDRIGELPAHIQTKLLRVVEKGEVHPVGEDRPVKVDVRIIAATHRDLLQMSAEGKFREDLYYRLKVVHLHVPALRERSEDIPLLAKHFLGEHSRRFAVEPFKLTPTLLDRLNAYSWPGNVREFENAIESLVALAHGTELDLALVPNAGESPPRSMAACDLRRRIDAYERGLIVAALEDSRGNRTHAARVLCISRETLHGKLRKYGLASSDARRLRDARRAGQRAREYAPRASAGRGRWSQSQASRTLSEMRSKLRDKIKKHSISR